MEALLARTANKLSCALGIPLRDAEEALENEKELIHDLAQGISSRDAVVWVHQVHPEDGEKPHALPRTYVADPGTDTVNFKGLILSRTGCGGTTADVSMVEVVPEILPLLQQLFGALDPRTSDVSSRVATAAPAPGAGIDFAPLDERDAAVLRSWDHRSFARLAAAEPELASRCALLLQQWCSVLSSAIIDEGSPASRRSTGTGGLAQEVRACRERRAALAAAVEHAQSDACRCVVGMASKGAAALEWRSQQQGLGEALSDAEDCLQYLEVVQELMQGLRSGTLAEAIEGLPNLVSALATAQHISRHFSQPASFATVLQMVEEELVAFCQSSLEAGGRLWDRKPCDLLMACQACQRLEAQWQAALMEERLNRYAGKGSAPPAAAAPSPLQAFRARCAGVELISQRAAWIELLAGFTDLEGVPELAREGQSALDRVRRQPYNVLDTSKQQFGVEVEGFAVHMARLEAQFETITEAAFSCSHSTTAALELLQRLSNNALHNSEYYSAKRAAIFQIYADDLEGLERHYERRKMGLGRSRNALPLSGDIAWTRHLLDQIEGPMKIFSQDPVLMAAKENRRVVRRYNRLAETLLHAEAVWHARWQAAIPALDGALAAPLLLRDGARVAVNLDRSVLEVVREARHMRRLGLEVPNPMPAILLQQDRLQRSYKRIALALQEWEDIEQAVQPVLRPVLEPCLDFIKDKLLQGLTITWASTLVEGYLHRLEQAILQAGSLIRELMNIWERQIVGGQATLRSLFFLDVSAAPVEDLELFVDRQRRTLEQQLCVGAVTLQRMQHTLLQIRGQLAGWAQTHLGHEPGAGAMGNLAAAAQRLVDEAAQAALHQTLAGLLQLLGPGPTLSGRTSTLSGAGGPLIRLEVHLLHASVALVPSVATVQKELQGLVLEVQTKVLSLHLADQSPAIDARPGWVRVADSLHGMLVQVVSSVDRSLLMRLIGSVDECAFLWEMDAGTELEAFIATTPSLEDYEDRLALFDRLEQAMRTHAAHAAHAFLQFDAQPLLAGMIDELASWKALFTERLRVQGSDALQALSKRLAGLLLDLERPVEDLEDYRHLSACLSIVHDMEFSFGDDVEPIEYTYALLGRVEAQIPKQELDAVADLRYSWQKVLHAAAGMGEVLLQERVGLQRQLVVDVQALRADTEAFLSDWEQDGPLGPGLPPSEALARTNQFQQMFEARKARWEACISGEALFGMQVTKVPGLASLERELANLHQFYSLFVDLVTAVDQLSAMPWREAASQITSMLQQVASFQSRSETLSEDLASLPAQLEFKDQLKNLSDTLSLVQGLANSSIRPRHWQRLQELCGTPLPSDDTGLILGHLLNAQLSAHWEELEELFSCAKREEQIEQKLGNIEAQWTTECFVWVDHKLRPASILKASDTSELMERLEDALLGLTSLMSNRYSACFRPDIQAWTSKLSTISDVMEQWLVVQNMWMYMEAVFSGGDIVRQLPQEARRFAAIDKSYENLLRHARESQTCLAACCNSDVMQHMLPSLVQQLEVVQKSLSAYLESKRSEFSRFYFVADATLLEILSLGSEPAAVVPHFQSGLFDALHSITFDKNDKNCMLGMNSFDGEAVRLSRPIQARGNVEVWLQQLVAGMQETLRVLARQALRDVYEQDLETFLFSHPAQIALLGLQFQWTLDTHLALAAAGKDKSAVMKVQRKADGILQTLVSLTLRNDLTSIQRTSLETCITVYMHQKEALDDLVRKKIKDPSDFEWQKQARFYWLEERVLAQISICDVDFEYSFEYLGVKERLVITPLTDVCYITLSQALGMFMGGAPAGPAGTGKTETTKDLGNTLGKYVVVFNCSDQMDIKGMGKIFKGLAQSGLWGCFDEFNRINVDVLSVCAQQIHSIFSALREQKTSFLFTDGTTIPLDPHVGIFITMNPGYAGRQELPENLKVQFRGVTMMVPNRQIIMKVKLAACGYQENDVLSRRFHTLYGLCEQQLSRQPHYDFGLRNILAVLRSCGSLKRQNPQQSEMQLLMRALRDMNVSKLVGDDLPLFLSLVEDVFPGQKLERMQLGDVQAMLKTVAKEAGLQTHGPWLNKCMQLHETNQVRHGIMVIGPAGAGKTSVMESLAAAHTRLGAKTVLWRMNPKSMRVEQMFGQVDPATGEWTDGVFAVLWRRAARAQHQHTWIVMDGPIDAIWIENLNSVLDDNKVLTLSNGDRIQMTQKMRAMFEAENLNNASPATVSRAGIVYVSPADLGWQPMLDSWLAQRRTPEALVLRPLFDRLVAPLLDHVRSACTPIMPVEACGLVGTLLTLLTGMLDGVASSAPDGGAAMTPTQAPQLESVVLFCLAWSLGGLLENADRTGFDAKLRNLSQAAPPLDGSGLSTIYDYVYDVAGARWTPWVQLVPRWSYPTPGARVALSKTVVPTLDSTRYGYLMKLVHAAGKPVLIVGQPGTGKSTLVRQYLSRAGEGGLASKTLVLSSLTSPGALQYSVERSMEKRQGRSYGPPTGRRMTMFFDDINMPAINEWGDQPTNELTRQLLSQSSYYSLEKPIGDLNLVVDVQYVACMRAPGVGSQDIPSRLKRQFAIFGLPSPSVESVSSMFGAVLEGRFHTAAVGRAVADAASSLVAATLAVLEEAQANLQPTLPRLHYQFSLHDVAKVVQGMLHASSDHVLGKHPGSSPPTYIAGLWRNEVSRVFGDKLVCAEDKAFLATVIASQLDKAGHGGLGELVQYAGFTQERLEGRHGGALVLPAYMGIPQAAASLKTYIEGALAGAGSSSRSQNAELVMFDDALGHTVGIARLLGMERGSAVLVGVGGSGKQSLARLAATLVGASVFQITMTKQYGVPHFLEDLKVLCKALLAKNQPICFIATDAEMREDAFLQHLNQLLVTGDIPELFTREEMDALLSDLRPAMKLASPDVPDTAENLRAHMAECIQTRLHLVLCCSPAGPQFRRWIQQFPSLLSACQVDWFLPWPEDAMVGVAGQLLHSARLPVTHTSQLQRLMARVHQHIAETCQVYLRQTKRAVHVTPKSFLSFVNNFKSIYQMKLQQTTTQITTLTNGLQRMAQTREDVANMQTQLASKTEKLEAAASEAKALLHQISVSTSQAEKDRQKVAAIVETVTAKAHDIAAVKHDAERDLEEAQPALQAALAALNSITPTDITSLKALKNPPNIVKRIFDCVLLLRHFPVNNVAWQELKGTMVIAGSYEDAVKMMGDLNFLQSLIHFPKEAICDETVELLQPYFSAPDFNFASAKKASGNVAGLCNWAEAMCKFHAVAKVVEPKISALRDAEAELKLAARERMLAEEDLAVVQGNLDQMQQQLDAAIAQKQALEHDLSTAQSRMTTASSLLTALKGEEGRWTMQLEAYRSSANALLGDCIVAASFLSYLGPFNKAFRDTQLQKELAAACTSLGVATTPHLQVLDFLVDEQEKAQWVADCLPADELSQQNGVIVSRASQWPLLIDPQGQARAWLLKKEEAKSICTVQAADAGFRATLESCLQEGRPLLIENIDEEVDPILDPILERRFITRGGTMLVTLGETEVEVATGFRLYITTRLPNPNFTPELAARVTLVDCTVARVGLEDQLLSRLILKEKHELEHQRRKLVAEVQNYHAKISELEEELLQRLSNCENLLEDGDLLNILARTKQTVQDVDERLATASDTRKKIQVACEEYRPAARRAMLLYFLITDFSVVNCMYQTSLAQFTALYERSIDQADRSVVPAKRVLHITDHFTYAAFLYVCRGLFERHRAVFAFALSCTLMVAAGQASSEEVAVLLDVLPVKNDVPPRPREWLSKPVWHRLQSLQGLRGLSDILAVLARGDAAWHAWAGAEMPESLPLPELDARVSPLQRVLVVWALREDRAMMAAARCVRATLGERYTEPPPAGLEEVLKESGPSTPIICLLSPGADPTEQIETRAKQAKAKLSILSMGQGQEVAARRLVSTAALEGRWVLLQNTHLNTQYLAELERQLAADRAHLHPDFRLWLTTSPHPDFPIGLLHAGLRSTNEAPTGLRAGLKTSYAWVSQDTLDAVNRPDWRQLVYITCFMHAVLQGRRRFGPIGWTIPYAFDQADLAAALHFLQNHMAEVDTKRGQGPNWGTLQYMVAMVQYGGRVSEDADRRLLQTLAEHFYAPAMLARGASLHTGGGAPGPYAVPDAPGLEAHQALIQAIPEAEAPEVYGLNSSAELAFCTVQVHADLAVLAQIQLHRALGQSATAQPGAGEAHDAPGGRAEECLGELCAALLARLPAPLEVPGERGGADAAPPRWGPGPLTVCVRQEAAALNRVLHYVMATLASLARMAAGTGPQTPALGAAAHALLAGGLPPDWAARSWDGPGLARWEAGLVARHEQLARWLGAGAPPPSLWLGGLANPAGLLLAVRQEAARRHAAERWSLDDMGLAMEVTRLDPGAVREGPPEGIYVHGLALEGAGWSRRHDCLVEAEAGRPLAAMPVLLITAVPARDRPQGRVYEAPCFRTPERGQAGLVASLPLRTSVEPAHWVLRGVALICAAAS
ncbi:DHC15 [Auxenochlorella protothecoides x Auxenochlorella symbiontica]